MYRTIFMNFEPIDLLNILFVLFIYYYVWVAEDKYAAEVWTEVSTMHSLMLYPVWLEQPLALWAVHLRFTIRGLWLVGIPIRYHRLLMAQHTWTEPDVTFEDLLLHLLHALRCLYIPLMQLAVYYLGHLLDLLPDLR